MNQNCKVGGLTAPVRPADLGVKARGRENGETSTISTERAGERRQTDWLGRRKGLAV